MPTTMSTTGGGGEPPATPQPGTGTVSPECRAECDRRRTVCQANAEQTYNLNLKNGMNAIKAGQLYDEAVQACTSEWGRCVEGCSGGAPITPGGCRNDAECPEGQVCRGGQCVDKTIGGGGGGGGTGGKCPKGNYYASMDGTCDAGYVHIPRSGTGWEGYTPGATGRCECVAWCVEKGYGESCTGSPDTEKKLGTYEWPPELMGLYDQLMGRANEYLTKEPGYSEEEKLAMFGRDADTLRQGGAAANAGVMDYLASMGLLGTSAGAGIAGNQAWQTEQGISNTIRDLFIQNELQKRQDLADYTRMAEEIFGAGQNFNFLGEQINAGRRGEQSQWMALLLQYFNQLLNSNAQ